MQTVNNLNLTENALIVLEKRYLKKDGDGNVIETPEEMFHRVAKNIASAELIYNPKAVASEVEEEFYEIMVNLEFLPNSPTLMNAGRELQQLAACFVLPVEDSLDSIFEAVKDTAIIHQSGGGTGFSFSRLRPKNDRVSTTSGVASGPVSFMKVFNTATEVIKQGGARRGANMGILSVDHPDILEFIRAKENPAEFTNFNLSVGIDEKFMKSFENDSDYDLINPRNNKVKGKLKAKDVFHEIVDAAWKNGEPGIVFLDTINRFNPTPHLGKIEATNPCGEQPLLPYEACNLGSINLTKMLKKIGDGYEIDYNKLERTIKTGVRFLDNVIDVNKYPLPQINRMCKGNRKIGLGIMGFADMLILLNIPYNSQKALDTAEELMKFIEKNTKDTSTELANERGVFPNYNGSIYEKKGILVRNATTTTIAPTGTLSIIANCSSGIEPLYGITYTRKILDDVELKILNPNFEEIAKRKGFHSKKLIDTIIAFGSIQERTDVPDDVKRLFITAHDITPEDHIRIQAAFQKYTDNAVSKTVNFHEDAQKADIEKAFLLAYKLGCKGVTIYRSGS
ncbi:MAG: ribonucleoside-diphosphate reductase, adenosylcobalamin-dependent, partial [Nitrospirae bacterium RBG_19FT_COMBO_42_15]